jgi:membrane-bound inhibitor of C-type lysozyme
LTSFLHRDAFDASKASKQPDRKPLMRDAVLAASFVAVALTACSQMPGATGSSIPPGSRQFEYKCADGTRFDVLMAPAGDKAKLDLRGVLYELKQVRSASGAKFSDGTMTYWSKGRDATIERAGKTLHRDCRTNDL